MTIDLPEITTVGSLFLFAIRLEEAAASFARAASARASSPAAKAALEQAASRHEKRASEVERAKREKANETVLEPLTDMLREQYLPTGIDRGVEGLAGAALTDAAARVEETLASFYADAASKAGHVLGEVRRQLERYARESQKAAQGIRAS